MNCFSANFQYLFALYTLIFTDARYNALVNFQGYLSELYSQEWNRDEASELDPTTANASTRLQICDDISGSGIFADYGMIPVDTEEVYEELTQSKYSDIFHRIYSPSASQDSLRSHTYTNPYTLREFRITKFDDNFDPILVYKKEYVFVCLLRRIKYVSLLRSDTESSASDTQQHSDDSGEGEGESSTHKERVDGKESEGGARFEERPNDIIQFYVSKAYDVKSGLHVHRFVFLDPSKFDGDEQMLAEGSATAYVRSDFNVELHYLELRKHHKPAPTFPEDPLLKYDFNDHLSMRLARICTIVAASSYFRAKVGQPIRVYHTTLRLKKISFKTDEGVREADGKLYQERMGVCSVLFYNEVPKDFYISRAYNPFQVFLYLEDPLGGGALHLEMLATNVPMAQDRHNIGDVEI